ncbi:G-protein coupled receptor 143-like [Venturia canescens]|uniref:G-protein coupled receptor 143-like n=1 Tax=Venturia canescens TaxID=32260 RepID=UPI001C9D40BB|nr:G-protein coupled receptor 143-like [Venturia canescens]XP_043272095.1 G-protein coupled receptor 143-like [Venturia canescens]XP_043272096.1 G-protein coupled receptor 143-like [Venturia canescens]XP_043272098.1 G-protein coupled receptor 143-like [Venturia canescens]
MADPTIQTFCCHHNNSTDMAVVIMQEFNTDTYNTVCMLSSAMGILGAIYQILPRQTSSWTHRCQNFSASRGKDIIISLAIADLFASLGVFVRSALWMNFKSIMPMEDDTSSVVFCALSSAWTQYFYMATWIWTLCYAYDMKLLLGERAGHPSYYHAIAWICPAVLTTFGLTILYIPDANCHNLTSLSTAILRILPNYCATYVLLAAVMIVNPALYVSSTRNLQDAVNCSLSQVTGRERKLVQTIKLKFALTNIVYYVCWVPNLINGILLWTLWFQLPIKVIITLWYIMAVTNPLQAFFNSLVYRRWGKREKLRTEWCLKKLGFNKIVKEDESSDFSESSPLLTPKYAYTPHTSINGSSSL